MFHFHRCLFRNIKREHLLWNYILTVYQGPTSINKPNKKIKIKKKFFRYVYC